MSTDRIALEERRLKRQEWRAAGGSERRALKTFLTDAEKRERREEHAARIHEAVDSLQTPEGFAEWMLSYELNPEISPLNAALLALQCPGEIAGTAAFWKRNGYRIRKGETARAWITGPGFWPRAVFTATQADAGDLAELGEAQTLPDGSAGAEMLERLIASGRKAREAVEEVAASFGLREVAP